MTRRFLIVVSVVVSMTGLAAQSERITVRMAPAPNQTLHLRSTQEMTMTTDVDAPPAGSTTPAPSGAVVASMIVESTSAVGPTDRDGHYSAKMTVDHASATVTMDGKLMPLPAILDDTAKPVITFSYDQDGKVIDVAADGMAGGASIDGVKQMMARAFATVAPLTLSVGESVTVPTALNLPLAGGAVAPAGFTAETRYTLTSVTFDGADRIAHLTTHMTTTLAPGPDRAPAGSPPGMDMTMTSDGKTDVNIDRGIVLHSEQQMTMEGSMLAGAGPAPRKMAIHGKISIVSDLVK